jgi:hypothetical protein
MTPQPPHPTVSNFGGQTPSSPSGLTAGGAIKPIKDWKMTWGDYNALFESDMTASKKRRGY